MKEKLSKNEMKQLCRAVLSLKSESECERFFEDLCTMSELKAMSQRLEVALMLSEKRVYSDISASTGASTATISRVNRCLQYGSSGYSIALKRMREDMNE
jgi:TrpR-related protein YerC/YecD